MPLFILPRCTRRRTRYEHPTPQSPRHSSIFNCACPCAPRLTSCQLPKGPHLPRTGVNSCSTSDEKRRVYEVYDHSSVNGEIKSGVKDMYYLFLMNIDARSAGPPSFVRQPAIYQQNPKELQHPSQHSSAVNHRWSSRIACSVRNGGKGKEGCVGGIQGDECTKLGLRPSNRAKIG